MSKILSALRKRYAPPAWCFLEEVRNKAGHGGGPERYADGLAMSLWPSRGLQLHGFEVKISRSDWVRERDNPEKAEPISVYCDFWWLVVDKSSIVKDGELPPNWGLMVLDEDGRSFTVVREAPKRTEVEPLTHSFLAAILKRATEYQADWIHRSDVDARVEAATAERVQQELKSHGDGRWREDYERKKALLEKIAQETGILYLDDFTWPYLKRAYDLVMSSGHMADYRASIEHSLHRAKHAQTALKKLLDELPNVDKRPDDA